MSTIQKSLNNLLASKPDATVFSSLRALVATVTADPEIQLELSPKAINNYKLDMTELAKKMIRASGPAGYILTQLILGNRQTRYLNEAEKDINIDDMEVGTDGTDGTVPLQSLSIHRHRHR